MSTPNEDNDKDEEMCERLRELQGHVQQLANTLPSSSPGRQAHLDALLTPHNEHLVRYIGCLALGGPDGKRSWEQLIEDDDCRR